MLKWSALAPWCVVKNPCSRVIEEGTLAKKEAEESPEDQRE